MKMLLKNLMLNFRKKRKGQATDGPDRKKSKEDIPKENALKVIP